MFSARRRKKKNIMSRCERTTFAFHVRLPFRALSLPRFLSRAIRRRLHRFSVRPKVENIFFVLLLLRWQDGEKK